MNATPANQITQRDAGTTGALHHGVEGMGSSKKIRGPNFPHVSEAVAVPESERAIKGVMSRAVRSLPVKRAAEYADTTEETVKNWRQNRNAPRFVESIRLARKVPQIEAAIIELMRAGRGNPQEQGPVNFLLDALVAIADQRGDHAKLAKDALRRFSEAKGCA